ncbi:DNA internalization-related competence protein ComEC/Rec2 [candidate division TA06 bacterium]|nr:DNA internalization-related competence protein ComEC/Rec2 [candidate division TA06 bacterium]
MKGHVLVTLLLFGSGILLSHFFSPPLYILLSLLAVLLLFSLFSIQKEFSNLLILAALILSGLLYHEFRTESYPPHHLSRLSYSGMEVRFKGRILQDPLPKGENLLFICKGESLFTHEINFSITGKVQVTALGPHEEFRYGDVILVRGRLIRPRGLRNPGGFDLRAHLAHQGVFGLMRVEGESIRILQRNQGNPLIHSLILPVKHFMERTFQATLSGEPLGLLLGITLGEREALSYRVKRAFADTGTIHLLAISGLHVGIIGIIIFGLLRALRIPFHFSLIATNLFLLGYAFLTGLHPPVIRATVMSFSITAGLLLEREIDLINSLAIAGLLLLLITPSSLFSVGTQLSFAATYSILYLVNRFQKLVPAMRKRTFLGRWVLLPLGVSIAAQLGVAPLLVYHFHLLPLASILANLVLIPLVGSAIALGFTTVLASLISLPLAQLFSAANWFVLTGILRSVEILKGIPFSSFHLPTPPIFLILFYYLFLILIVQVKGSHRARKRLLFLTLIVLNLFLWHQVFQKDRMEVTFLDVGQGDATYLKFPNGRTMLIDGGDRYEDYDAGERVISPFFWHKGVRRIDLLLLTHPHKDHLGGLPFLLDHFSVGMVIDAGIPYPSYLYLEFLQKIQEKGIPYQRVRRGDRIQGFGFPIAILHPTNEIAWIAEMDRNFNLNDGSVVIHFQEKEISFLFPGDIQEEATNLTEELKWTTVLKVPHHGSRASNPHLFVSHFSPEIAVISCGFQNRFGFPEKEVLERYQKVGSRIYRTDRGGAVHLQTDGEKVEVTTMETNPRRFWELFERP